MLKKIIFGFLIYILIQISNTVKIHLGEKLLLPYDRIFQVSLGCREIRIPNNYKKLKLKLESNDLSRLLVTDIRINSCNHPWDIKSCCSKNSTFCLENSNPTKNEFQLNYCIDQTFIYACYNLEDPSNNITKIIENEEEFVFIKDENKINNTNMNTINNTNLNFKTDDNTSNNNSTEINKNNSLINNNKDNNNMEINNNFTINNNNFTITTNETIKNDSKSNIISNNTEIKINLNKNRILISEPEEKVRGIHINATIIRGEGCTTAEYLPETECSTFGILKCMDQSKCNKDCSFIECRKNKEDQKSKVFSMCLPKDLDQSEIQERCSSHIAFKDITPQIYKVNCTNKNDIIVQEKISSQTFFKFILILFGIFILILFISSIYFRYHMNKYEIEPFSPPKIIPNFIYPRFDAY
jgi:hypothetical protein